MAAAPLLNIRLLGELQLVRGDGAAVVPPASRKTRALLGYLIATGQAHRRERLCDLFWDGPDDPRAELRWSLSRDSLAAPKCRRCETVDGPPAG